MITQHDINNAYSGLTFALQTHWQTAELTINSKIELETGIADATYDGRIDGKNETIRAAQARELFPELFTAYENNERHERRTKHQLDMAKLEVERVRALMRLAQLTKTNGNDEDE